MILRFWCITPARQGGFLATQYQQGKDGFGETVSGPTGKATSHETLDEMRQYLTKRTVSGKRANDATLAREQTRDPNVIEVWW